MEKLLDWIYALLWGKPMLLLMLGIGVWLTACTGCVQIRLFPQAVRSFLHWDNTGHGGASSFRALCTALAATVGTGNIAGVAGAICLGGPGAVFWMLVFSFLGMAVKYAEAALAVRYHTYKDGEILGGPMYMIQLGLPKAFLPLAGIYSFCGILASFGVGNLTQVNAIVTGVQSAVDISPTLIGLVLMGLVGFAFWKGTESIGRIAECLVPFAAGMYITLCLVFLACKMRQIPAAVQSILVGAFSPKAVSGGIIGSAMRAVQVGCSRGVFTHEAGMGTASIAHAAANTDHPAVQGMMGLMEVFLDTFVICTMTALVILCSGCNIPYGIDTGAQLTIIAFSAVYGRFGKLIVSAFLAVFAYATILGWSFYGVRCTRYLFGRKLEPWYFTMQTAAVLLGAIINTSLVWKTAEIFNGIMAIPNLLVLLLLSPVIKSITNSYTSESSIRKWR